MVLKSSATDIILSRISQTSDVVNYAIKNAPKCIILRAKSIKFLGKYINTP